MYLYYWITAYSVQCLTENVWLLFLFKVLSQQTLYENSVNQSDEKYKLLNYYRFELN